MNPSTLVSLANLPHYPQDQTAISVIGVSVITAVVLAVACLFVSIVLGPQRSGDSWKKRNIAIVAGSSIIAATLFVLQLLIVSIPTTASIYRGNHERTDTWTANAARWAHDQYGVTEGMRDLNFETWSSDALEITGTVVAQGRLRDVSLRWVGDQAFLIMKGDSNNELPRVTVKH